MNFVSSLAIAVALASPVVLGAPITAVPPATYAPPPAAKAAPTERALAADAPRLTIDLGAPSAEEWAALRAQNRRASAVGAPMQKAKRLAIGMTRTVPGEGVVAGASLQWVATADGGYAARIDLRSTGAAATRVGVAMPQSDPDVSLRFTGSQTGAQVFPVAANSVAAATRTAGVYWSPVLEGDTATIEVIAPAGVDRDAITLSVASVAHLALAGSSLARPTAKDLSEIGTSGACNVDVACVAAQSLDPNPNAVATAANAVALIVFNDARFVYECSGTLVNDSIASNTPYLYTANHCLQPNDQLSPITPSQLAATMNFYWLFQATTCNSRSVPPYALQAAGATVLGRSDDWDWALLRVNGALPAGVAFSGWRAEPLTTFGTSVIALHHPNGDLTKYSKAAVQGLYARSERDSTYTRVIYSLGTTEAGSSGGGLFTLGPSGYELRGGLWGGSASCSDTGGDDQYSRLDIALPLVRQYLAPNDTSSQAVAAVEFYNASLDHYFISTNPGEINDLDTGVHIGWVRTGLRFLAYPDASHAPPDANPVCRFYREPPEDSHFYSASPQECADTAAKFVGSWVYESASVFYIQLPNTSTGACPANTRPLWRFYHTTRINHRYTAEVAVRDQLRADPTWTPEGYGPDAVIMCSPTA